MKNTNYLICVSGLTPQIITETFYCLSVLKKIQIDKVYIITTSKGRDIIYGSDRKYNLGKPYKYPPFKKELLSLCKKYNIKNPKFENNDAHVIVAKELTNELNDIRNDIHNRLFPNKVCDIIRKLTSIKGNILHCCISGGRKTMSVDLAFALSLFGRDCDKLYHVITDEEFEFKNFYPVTKKEESALTLAEIPFVRLRFLFESKNSVKMFKSMNYTDLVEKTQRELMKRTIDKLYIDIPSGSVRFSTKEWIHLPKNLLDTYLCFYEAKLEKIESIHINDLSVKFYGDTKHKQNILSRINKLNKLICSAIEDVEIQALFVILGPREKVFKKGHYSFYATTQNFEIIE